MSKKSAEAHCGACNKDIRLKNPRVRVYNYKKILWGTYKFKRFAADKIHFCPFCGAKLKKVGDIKYHE